MLEDLNTIDWKRLSYFGHRDRDIPQLIRGLAADDTKVRQRAYQSLLAPVEFEVSVTEATVYIVPFLIELLAHESVRDKHNILYLIEHYTLHSWPEGGPEAIWVEKTYQAIRKGLNVYLELLHHPDATVREETIYLLEELHEDSVRIASALFLDLTQSSDEMIRLAAAASLTSIAKSETPPDVVRMLVEEIRDLYRFNEMWIQSVLIYTCERILDELRTVSPFDEIIGDLKCKY
ncbi:MAG: HEAT repeat domain-containing protein [Chloroflexota bacterium]